MKALFIYNPHSAQERQIIERAEQEMSTYITVKSLDEIPLEVKNMVSATPALIIISDDLQGENLLGDSVDGKLIASSMLYKRLEEEEEVIHQQETHRLDNMIKHEITEAIDDYTMELIVEGVI